MKNNVKIQDDTKSRQSYVSDSAVSDVFENLFTDAGWFRLVGCSDCCRLFIFFY